MRTTTADANIKTMSSDPSTAQVVSFICPPGGNLRLHIRPRRDCRGEGYGSGSILPSNGFVPEGCYDDPTTRDRRRTALGKLHEVEIHRLRPTQITVGMIEVRDKRDHLLSLKKHEQRDFMAAHPTPAVWGPDGRLYITDHHHLGRAASEADVDTGFFHRG